MGALTGSGQGDRFSFGRIVAGRYRIEELVGRGGMGEVFRAYDERLKMPVALKTLPAHLATDPIRRGLFEREITAQARATHPYVAQVLEIAEDAGQLFLVMEFIEGQPLSALLRNARPSVADVQEWGRQIAQALAAIHERGLLHCDLKPGNVMITPQGIVKVTDFGIAQLPRGLDGARVRAEVPPPDAGTPALPTPAHAPEDADGDTNATHGTIGDSRVPGAEEIDTLSMLQRPRSNAGTPAYMSPEQHDGLDVDGRTDLFSLGIVLWECVTGRHPFYRERIDAVREAICTEPPANLNAREWRGHTNLRRLVLRLLEKDPARRFATAAEVADALEKLREPWPLWLRASVAAGVVAVVAVSSIAAGWPDRHPYWPPSHWLERDWPKMTSDEEAVVGKIAALQRDRRFEDSVGVAQAATGRAPNSLRIIFEFATALRVAGHEARARDAADTAAFMADSAGYGPNDLPRLDVQILRALERQRPLEEVAAFERLSRHWLSKRPRSRTELASAYCRAGSFTKAKALLSQIVLDHPDDGRSRLLLAQVHADLSEFDSADRSFDTARKLLEVSQDPEREYLLADTSGYIEFRRPDYARAAERYSRAEVLSRNAGLTLQAAAKSKIVADALARRRNASQRDFEEADRRYREVAATAEALGDFRLFVLTLTARGGLLRLQGSADAEAVLLRAVDEARRLDDETIRVQSLATLANLALEHGRKDDADRFAREVLDLTSRHEDRENRNNALFVLTGLDVGRGKIDEGIASYRRIAEREAAADGRIEDRAYASGCLLEVEHYAERPADALRDGNVAVELYRRVQDQTTLAFVLVFRSRVLAELGRIGEAEHDLAETRSIVQDDDPGIGPYLQVAACSVDLERHKTRAVIERARHALGAGPITAADEEVALRLALAIAVRTEGDLEQALAETRAAFHVEHSSAAWRLQARVLEAELLAATGRSAAAGVRAREAIADSTAMGMRLSEARSRNVLVCIGEDVEQARARRALENYEQALPADAVHFAAARPLLAALRSYPTHERSDAP